MKRVAIQHPGKRIQPWFQDEARIGLKGTVCRVWARRSSRLSAKRQTKYECLYVFGAVCPATGKANGWIMPTANTEAFNIQLADIGDKLPRDVHAVMVLDRAGLRLARCARKSLVRFRLPAQGREIPMRLSVDQGGH